MRPHVLLLAAGLSLPLAPLTAPAQDAPPTADVASLQAKIDQLERENETLRMQWGQATMELDRLRKENERLKRAAGAPVSAGKAAPAEAPAPQAAPPAEPGNTPAAAPALQAEVDRLRRENEDLRSEKHELIQLAGVTAEGENVAAQNARITTTFDESANQTVVRTEPQAVKMLAGSSADHYLSVVYTYPGRELTDRGAAEVVAYLQTRHSGGVHAGDQAVEFTLDGETLTVPITDYRVDQRTTTIAGRRRINKGDETVGFALDAEALRRLARTVQGEARIGNVRIELSRDDVAMFKAVQMRIEKGI